MRTDGILLCSGGAFRWGHVVSWMLWRMVPKAPWPQVKWWLWPLGSLLVPRWATSSIGIWAAPKPVSTTERAQRFSLYLWVWDHWWSTLSRAGQGSSTEMSKMTLPLEVYRNISRSQTKFLDTVSHFLPENIFSSANWLPCYLSMLLQLCVKKKKKWLEQLRVLRYSSRHKPNSCCPVLLQVTQKSGARVRISSDGGESEGHDVCFQLHGSKEQVLLARCVLQNLAIDCEPVVEVLEVPQAAFGRIIGNSMAYSFNSLVQHQHRSFL